LTVRFVLKEYRRNATFIILAVVLAVIFVYNYSMQLLVIIVVKLTLQFTMAYRDIPQLNSRNQKGYISFAANCCNKHHCAAELCLLFGFG